MTRLRHDVMLVAGAITLAWLLTPWLRIGWMTTIAPTSYSTTLPWLDYGFLSAWVFEFMWGAVIAVWLTRLLLSRGALLWSLVIGAQLGGLHLAFSHWHFGAHVPTSVYVWAYGEYLMPVIGAFVASRLVSTYWPKAHPTMEKGSDRA